MIVVDASVLIRALGQEGIAGAAARRRLRGQSLVAPHLIDVEVVSAWRQLLLRGQMTALLVERCLVDLRDLPLSRISHQHLIGRCWEMRDNLTPYDAAYIAVAELFDATLLTADGAMARAPGIRCEVEVLPES